MAKDNLKWVSINVESLPQAIAAKHAKLKAAFQAVKDAKASLETEVEAWLNANVAKLPVSVQADLLVEGGRFPAGTERKFSYLYGMAVATAPIGKTKAKGGSISFK